MKINTFYLKCIVCLNFNDIFLRLFKSTTRNDNKNVSHLFPIGILTSSKLSPFLVKTSIK